jgi:phosphoglycolate phosphatase-like HAD superfamily hydrolase
LPSVSPAIDATLDATALDAVVFDFDGVIVESVDVKNRAFRALFADHPAQVDAIVALHEQHGGVSRYVKFDMIYRDILKAPLTPSRRTELGQEFERLAVEQVVACPMVGGARELLEALHGRVPMTVVSGTPDAELAAIVARRGLGGYFVELHGGSREKHAIVADMIRARSWRAERMIMVGDAMTDHDAAHANGVGFVGRVAPGTANPFPPETTVIPDMRDFGDAAARVLALGGATV